MMMLRALADGGRTVIVVTHSMQSIRLCDRLLVLARGGSPAYFGAPQLAPAFALSSIGVKIITCEYHALASSFKYCDFDIMYAIELGAGVGSAWAAIATTIRSWICDLLAPARAISVRLKV